MIGASCGWYQSSSARFPRFLHGRLPSPRTASDTNLDLMSQPRTPHKPARNPHHVAHCRLPRRCSFTMRSSSQMMPAGTGMTIAWVGACALGPNSELMTFARHACNSNGGSYASSSWQTTRPRDLQSISHGRTRCLFPATKENLRISKVRPDGGLRHNATI